jgi:hypothetical protein
MSTIIYFLVIPYPLAFKIGKKVTTMIALTIIIKIQNKNILTQSHPVIVLSDIISTPTTIPVKTKIKVSHEY